MNLPRSTGLVGAHLLLLVTAGCSTASTPAASPPAAPRSATNDQVEPRGKPVATPAGSAAGPAAGWSQYRRPMTSLFVVEAVEASSTYPNWPASRLTDGDPSTSWFSDRDDSAAKGKTPSISLRLAATETVRRVGVLGNRDVTWPTGFSVLRGRVQLFGEQGNLLRSSDQSADGELHDLDFEIEPPVENTRFVIFSSLADEGNQNTYGDIGIAEIFIE